MTRGYGQYCGLARALDLVGGRWSLLIVRELLTGPKRFTELQQGLRGIPTNILSSRLRELEDGGLVERTLQPRPSSAVVYELTPYGLELEEPVMRLGLWGAKALDPPSPTDAFSIGALAVALRAVFRPERVAGHDLRFEIRFDGRRLQGSVGEEGVSFNPDPGFSPDVVFACAPEVFASMFAGDLDLDDAMGSGRLTVEGMKRDARRFFDIFRLPPRDRAVAGSEGANGLRAPA